MADIYTLFEVGVAGIGLASAIFLVKWLDQRQADRMRTIYELFFPSSMGPDQVLAYVRSLHILPKLKRLFPAYAVSFEHYAEHGVDRYFLVVGGHVRVSLDELFLEHVDGTIDPVEGDPVAETNWTKGLELAARRHGRPCPTRFA
jgi:hypothetical protein